MSFENESELPTPNLEFSFSDDYFIRKENSYLSKSNPSSKRFLSSCPYSKPTSLELSEIDKQHGQVKISSTYESLNPIYHVINISSLSFLEKLGEGSFGDVFKVRDETDNTCYAVKRIKRKLRNHTDRYHRWKEIINIQTIGDHVNLVRLICFWEDYSYMFMQFDLCSYSLRDFLSVHGPVLISDIWWILKDISLGLKHIHDNNFIHLDIKPANLFLSLDHNLVKIGDFGLLFHLSESTQNASEGDNMYMAPELLKRIFAKPADIFSLGLSILELLTNLDLPKHGLLWHKLRQDDLPTVLNKFPLSIFTIITQMLQSSPENRIQLTEIIFICNSEITPMKTINTECYITPLIIALIFNLFSLFKLIVMDLYYNIRKKILRRSILSCSNYGYCISTLGYDLHSFSTLNNINSSPSISQWQNDSDTLSDFIQLGNNSSKCVTSTPNQNNLCPKVLDGSPSFEIENMPNNDCKPFDQSNCFPRKLNFD